MIASWLATVTLFFGTVVLSLPVSAPFSGCSNGVTYFVAHPDDALLFVSPSLLYDLANKTQCVTSVFLTSGDSGFGNITYTEDRELGTEISTSTMVGAANSWSTSYATLGTQSVLVRSLTSNPAISIVWFRLPDGGFPDGSGYPVTGMQSIQNLVGGGETTITAVDGGSSFTLSTLSNALSQILTATAPSVVRTLDFSGTPGDHPDHIAVAKLVRGIALSTVPSAQILGYQGYGISQLPINVFGSDLTNKAAAFFTYTPNDSSECSSVQSCNAAGREEGAWLQRQYARDVNDQTVNVSSAISSSSTNAATTSIPNASSDIALNATASASSAAAATSQFASSAIDGVIDGYPGNYIKEWATVGGVAGSYLILNWTSPQVITSIVLYDRPNLNDQVTSGKITFSDGSSVPVGSLDNGGGATNVTAFAPITATSLTFLVGTVSPSTTNVGLAEIVVYGYPASQSASTSTSTATVSSTATSMSSSASQTSSTLASTSSGSSTISSTISSTNAVTATSTAVSATTSETSSSQASTSSGSSTISSTNAVTATSTAVPTTTSQTSSSQASTSSASSMISSADSITATSTAVTASSSISTTATSSQASTAPSSTPSSPATTSSSSVPNIGSDIALNATASASSAATATGQFASSAIDGVIDGCPGDYTKEWATNGEGVGASITLSWASPVALSRIVLYDRPNLYDQILNATLSFSPSGADVFTGTLLNNGSANTFNFPSRSVSSVTLTVTQVSSTTRNVGLSEFQAYA